MDLYICLYIDRHNYAMDYLYRYRRYDTGILCLQDLKQKKYVQNCNWKLHIIYIANFCLCWCYKNRVRNVSFEVFPAEGKLLFSYSFLQFLLRDMYQHTSWTLRWMILTVSWAWEHMNRIPTPGIFALLKLNPPQSTKLSHYAFYLLEVMGNEGKLEVNAYKVVKFSLRQDEVSH